MEVTGHKAHGLIPEPGSVVLARVKSSATFSFGFSMTKKKRKNI